MRRTLPSGLVAALWIVNSCAAQAPVYGTPASFRLYNPSTCGPSLPPGCNRCETPPCCNPGCFLDNPRGTGIDDPWRPPHHWPQTRYPVVPAYTRPSYGFYETSWRVLPLCNRVPTTAGPVMYPVAQVSNQQVQPAPTQTQQAPNGQLPRPPVVPPAVQPNQEPPLPVPPAATPPATTPPEGAQRNRLKAPGGPPKAIAPSPFQKPAPGQELQPQQPPKATPPTITPNQKGLNQGAVPSPDRAAMLDSEFEDPEIRVQPF